MSTTQGIAPQRVLHVVGSMDRGGAESLIMNVYRQLDLRRIQFDFVVHASVGDFEPEIRELRGQIYRVPNLRGYNLVPYIIWWARFLINHPNYRIIHGHKRSTASIYLGIARLLGRTTIAHSHNTSSGTGYRSIVKNALQLPLRHIAHYLFACSNEAAIWLFGPARAKGAIILNNGIDTGRFRFDPSVRTQTRHALGLGDQLVIGHVGRFHPQKNHQFLISVAQQLQERKVDFVLLLIGAGEERRAVEQTATVLGVPDRTHFLGSRDDVDRLMNAMDLFMFPSLHEGFPVVLVEAQATGLPCLVADSITKDVALTDLMSFLPLSCGPAFWADQTCNYLDQSSREDRSDQIADLGFDSKVVAKWLQDFYAAISRERPKVA